MRDVGEVRLHVVEARPKDFDARATPLVVLCHGFPEFWWSWRHQMRALADAGMWAVAPDMRGYGGSDKPARVAAYDVDRVADDVAGLIRALGRDRASVVGHDWGGAIAYHFAAEHGAMLDRLAILNAPHLYVMLRSLRRRKQAKKSSYMFLFQLPFGLAERAARKDDYAGFRKMFTIDGLAPDEIEAYIDALKTPGALTGGMSYYRAMTRRVLRFAVPRAKRIDRPVLVIWGDRDRHLGSELATPPSRWVPDVRVVHVANASHWVQNDAVAEVNALLVDFLGVR
jgi:pimeloyl-ACP methyl ester carboxylesterase